MARRVAGRPGARAAERDGIEHIPRGQTEYLEAAGIGGGGEHERVLAIHCERAHPIDGWAGVERHLIGSRVHHMGVVVVATGIACQVDLGAVQRDERVVAIGAGLDRADGFAVARIKDGVGAIRGIRAVWHIDSEAVRGNGKLVHAE